MASTDSVWTIMARLGPEDGLVAVQTRTNSSPWLTAGNDWTVEQRAKDTSGFYYKDTDEAVRLAAIVESNRCAASVRERAWRERALTHVTLPSALQPRKPHPEGPCQVALPVRAVVVCA